MVTPPFGRLLTAMVTPFAADGSVDLDAAASLAGYLVDELAHDGLVINGTTGESPTTSDSEKADLLRVVIDSVGDRAAVLAGVGTFDTEHTLELAAEAAKLGADGLLVVTPYYSKPPQAGLLEHFRRVADSTEVPVMLYDIPGRAGTAIASDTLLRLAEHPAIVAVKDAKGDLTASAQVMAQCDLAYYSGDDALTLPLLAVGAVGVVGTSTHFSAAGTKAMIEAYVAGNVAEALRWHRRLLPIYTGIFATQGCILVKAGLELQGRGVGGVRSPLVGATPAEIEGLRASLTAAGLGDLDALVCWCLLNEPACIVVRLLANLTWNVTIRAMKLPGLSSWRRPQAELDENSRAAALEWIVDLHTFDPGDLEKMATNAGAVEVSTATDELTAAMLGWPVRTFESTVPPGKLGWGWAKFAFGSWTTLSWVDDNVWRRVVPKSWYYNVMLTGVKPS